MSKVIFMGTPDFSTTILEMLIKEHEVIAIVTQPDRPVGRKRTDTTTCKKWRSNMILQFINQKS